MRKYLLAHLLLIAFLPFFTCAQNNPPQENPFWNLENLPRLTVIYPDDSVAIRASVDSLTPLLAGRWELVEIESGWGPNHIPARAVELVLDKDGHGTIYENGVWSAVLTLKLTRRWAMIRFTIEEPGRPFFNLHLSRQSGGGIRFDKQRLLISDGYADGTAYAFRRIPDTQPTRQYIQYSATALLNYKPWFGTANAVRVKAVKTKPCTIDRFSLTVVTDIPYDTIRLKQPNKVTGCLDGCVPTQLLRIDDIPLQPGVYETQNLDTCCATSFSGTQYQLLLGGDVAVETYMPRYGNRVWVTAYDVRTKRIDGKFELGLYTADGKYVYFSDGVFSATLKKP